VNSLTSSAGARRVLVLLLVAAGWLSILGNSPPAEIIKRPGTRSGPITIRFTDGMYGGGCAATGTFSAPVRRAALYRGDRLMHEVICTDGSNCLRRLSLPPDQNECTEIRPDAGVGDRPAGEGGPPRDAVADVSGDGSGGGGADSGSGSADAGVGADAGAAATAVMQALLTDAGAVPSERWLCTSDGGPPIELAVIQNSYVSYADCENESVLYKIVVETAEGVQSVQEYKITIKQPGGYFGC
jgi:hypothetical protein